MEEFGGASRDRQKEGTEMICSFLLSCNVIR